jgi:hypothetical protein
MLTFDHKRLVARHPTEVSRFRRWLLSASPGELTQVAVAHERNGSCCRREPWNVTAASIVLAVRAPTLSIMFNLNDEPAVN